MAKEVTVNLFDVEWDDKQTQKLSETLEEFSNLPLGDRWRGDIRLEKVVSTQVLKLAAYKLDFTKKREVGPGKLADGTAITSIRMERTENFGEETAAIFVPAKKWLLILHNPAGVGPSRMMAYCNSLDPGNANRHFDYQANPKLDPTVLQKLKSMKHISNLSVTATLDALNDDGASLGRSLAEASRPAQARRISFQMSANDAHKKGKYLQRDSVVSMLDRLLRRDDDVSKLQVTGELAEAGGKDMMIDLLQHKLRRKYNANELAIIEHRYTLESRWDLLDRSLRGWQNSL